MESPVHDPGAEAIAEQPDTHFGFHAGEKTGEIIGLEVGAVGFGPHILQLPLDFVARPGPDHESHGRLMIELADKLKIKVEAIATGLLRRDSVAVYVQRRYQIGRIGGKEFRLGPWLPDAFLIPPNLVRRPLLAAHVAAQVPCTNQPNLIFLADTKGA